MKQYFVSLKGQTLIELLLAMSLTAIFLPVLLSSFVSSREGRAQSEQRLDASQLQKEAIEAVRSVRERDWNEIAINGTFYPQIQESQWVLISGTEETEEYTRSIVISDVYRDTLGDIVETGGDLDPSTKRVDVSVSWTNPSPSSLTSTLFFARFENDVYTETLESEFSQGQTNGTVIVDNNGGEIILGSGGHGDWCSPTDYIVSQLNLQASGDARDVMAIEGKAFTGTHVGGTGKFYEIDISNTDPPVSTVVQSINGLPTNDIFIDDNYAYVATGDISKDIVIVDLTTGQQVGYFNDSYLFGTAQGIYVKDNVGYVTIGFRLHTFDLSSKSGERPELDSVSLGFLATGSRLQVVGNYAYIAVEFGLGELQIIDVSNPSSLSREGSANVNGERGKEVVVNETGTRAYLATAGSSSLPEFFVIDTTTKSGSLPVIGSYNAGTMDPTGVTVVPGNIAVMVGIGGEEYQVLDITNETNPVLCGGMQINNNIYGVSSVLESDNDAYSYIVTGDASSEFKIIQGGPGGAFADNGEFVSQTFDAGADVVFNRLIGNVTLPAQAETYFQVGIADAVAGSCSGEDFTFVGPDGTGNTLFPSTGGEIPISQDGIGFENPGRCFKYKAYLLTNDFASTPVINDVTINYSP